MFPERLKELRIERNLTQKELATLLDTSQQIIGFYEQGKRNPKQDILEKLSNFFKVSTNYLLGKTDIKTPEQSELDQAEFLFRTTVSELKLTEEQQEQFKKDIETFIEQRRKAFEEK